MQFTSNIPRIIAIPLLLVIVVACVILSSVFFAILLIPMAIAGFRFWRRVKLAQRATRGNVIDAEYTVIDKRQDEL